MKSFDLADALLGVGLVLLVGLFIVGVPIGVMVCLNWLSEASHWGWQIPLTFKTWFAIATLVLVVGR